MVSKSMKDGKVNLSNLVIVGFSCVIVGMVIATPSIASTFFNLGQLTDVNVTGVTDGQVIKYNETSSQWEPFNDSISIGGGGYDQSLNTTDSPTFFNLTLTNYPNLDKNSSDDFSGSWNDLTNIPSGFSDNIDNDTTDTNWDNLTNVPSGFADGVDNDSGGTIYYSDNITINKTGNTFELNLTWLLLQNFLDLDIYPNTDTDSTDDFSGSWNDLSNIPSGFADGIDNVSSMTSNIWNISGTDIYLNESYTQVGIGDSTPINSLELVGGFLIRSGLSEGYQAPSYGIYSEGEISVGDDGGSGNELTLYEATPSDQCTIKMMNADTGGASTDGYLMSLYTNTQFKHWLYENIPMVFATNNTERMIIDANGLINISKNVSADFYIGNGSLLTGINTNDDDLSDNTTDDLSEGATNYWCTLSRIKSLLSGNWLYLSNSTFTDNITIGTKTINDSNVTNWDNHNHPFNYSGYNQDLNTTNAVTFDTIDTGEGANELYDMNQNVLTSSDVEFENVTVDNTLDMSNGGITWNIYVNATGVLVWEIE